jgi:hypothetical protein
VAAQVPATSAGKVRRNVKPIGVPAGVRQRHHGSRWKHCCDGDIFSCRLVRISPDLAHEPRPRVNLLLGRALRAVRCELRQCLPATRCGGPPPHSEARARRNSSDIYLPLHQGVRYYTSSPMLLSSRPSARGYMIKRCWRSWPRMTWKWSPLSLLWPTSAPGLLRAVRGTQRHRPELPKRAAQVPSLRTTRKRRKRIAATRSRTPPPWPWQLRLGAGATTANAHGHRGVTAARAPCTPMIATAPQNAARSSTSRNVSVRGVSSLPGMAPHLVADPARKRPTMKRWPRLNRTSGINHPRGPEGCLHWRLQFR